MSIAMGRACGRRNSRGEREVVLVVAPPGRRHTDSGEYVADVYAARGRARRVARLSELREFLMSRRARVSPAEAGLPDGGARRRTPGLRREEVAVLAGVGASWYQWLEQGRDISVSPQVLDSVGPGAAAEQRRATASLCPGRAEPARGRTRPPYGCEGMRRLIDAWMPFPAHIMDRYYNCVMYNDAAGWVLGHAARRTRRTASSTSSPIRCTGPVRTSWETERADRRRAVPGGLLGPSRRRGVPGGAGRG